MKHGAKKILKWLGGILFIFVPPLGLVVYTLFCLDKKNIERYSYCCFVCVSKELKNFPLPDLIETPDYGVTLSADGCSGSDDEEFWANPQNKTLSFKTNESFEILRKRSENYFNKLGYRTNLKVFTLSKESKGSEIWFEKKNECLGLSFIQKDNRSTVEVM